MYEASVPTFSRYLDNLSAIIDKAAVHADAKNIDQAVYLGIRLYPDMFSFDRQVQQATNHALRTGWLAGVPLPDLGKEEDSFEALKARIVTTVSFLKSLNPKQIDGTEAKEIFMKFPNGTERTFTGQDFLLGFALPEFFFHLAMAYGLLRSAGVGIGKWDFRRAAV
jgi:hypothetical protein